MDGRRCATKGNGQRGAAGGASSSGKQKGKGGVGVGGGGGKKPIKVVYIGNPMRVTTSAEGFRALVQELTGRHADPSKYCGGGSPAIDVDDYSSGGSLQAEPQPGALPSPGGSTETSSEIAAAAAGQVPTQPPGFCDDDEDSFMPQLIDNSYSVFSPPTFLYDHHSDLM